jgi:hypothetical protein
MSRECLCCHAVYVPLVNVPAQQYCVKSSCQRTRRANWQRRKLSTDSDYRENQRAARASWRERHRDYMRMYRRKHPEYRDRDRKQRGERRMRREAAVAGAVQVDGTADRHCAVNMDECRSGRPAGPIESGLFRICRIPVGSAVNMDVCPRGSVVQVIVVKEDKAAGPVLTGAP